MRDGEDSSDGIEYRYLYLLPHVVKSSIELRYSVLFGVTHHTHITTTPPHITTHTSFFVALLQLV